MLRSRHEASAARASLFLADSAARARSVARMVPSLREHGYWGSVDVETSRPDSDAHRCTATPAALHRAGYQIRIAVVHRTGLPGAHRLPPLLYDSCRGGFDLRRLAEGRHRP